MSDESSNDGSFSEASEPSQHHAPVGLSDTKYSQSRRKMMEIINRLHSTGVQLDMDLPQISVIGSQSVGKSSLIESISGITLPRASGTCTRCPTECRLVQSNGPWKCEVQLRFLTDEFGNPQPVRNIQFGDTIRDKGEVEERLRRAQRAILNPAVDWKKYLEDDDMGEDALSFSSNCVSLQIEGPDVTDLSFCDLPGIIASVGEKGKVEDIELVKKLVLGHIQKQSCLVLLAVSCETDFENQGALRLAKQVDPQGYRTIGVLTKVDRIEKGNEKKWLAILRNEEERLNHGWFAVKQPNPEQLHHISREAAQAEERDHFQNPPWNDGRIRKRVGTLQLTQHLSKLLSDLIQQRLPGMEKELHAQLEQTEKELSSLPPPPPKDPVREVTRLVTLCKSDLSRLIEGTPGKDGLIQQIRRRNEEFKISIRKSAPEFRPHERPSSDGYESGESEVAVRNGRTVIPFLVDEEGELPDSPSASPIYLDDVLTKAQDARTRELPGHYPFIVRQELIAEFMKEWKIPALSLYHATERILSERINEALDKRFHNQVHGGLKQTVANILRTQLKLCRESCISKIDWFLKIERRPFTLNTHYLADYKTKFLTFYRSTRGRAGENAEVIGNLENPDTAASINLSERPVAGRRYSNTILEYGEVLNNTLSGLTNLGFHGVKAQDLAKLLPPDRNDEAMEIMAEVRAYYQVVYKRFVDYVPLMVDYELLGGLDRGVEDALHEGLQLSGSHAKERCQRLLAQAPEIVSARGELEARKDRLEAAKDELAKMWVV